MVELTTRRGNERTYVVESRTLRGINSMNEEIISLLNKGVINDEHMALLEEIANTGADDEYAFDLNKINSLPEELRELILDQWMTTVGEMNESFLRQENKNYKYWFENLGHDWTASEWHEFMSSTADKHIDSRAQIIVAQHALSVLRGEKDKETKKLEEIQRQQEKNEELIGDIRADKIVDVAVVTNLNKFIKDFFTGDKEGSFKHFSSTAIATIDTELSNINSTVKTELTNISNLVKEKLTSLINYEKLDKLIDNLIKTQWLLRGLQGTITTEFDTLYEDLTKHSEQKVKNDLKNFITEKFNNAFNGNNTQIFADIIKEEQAQTASLNAQLNELRETKNILNALLNESSPQSYPQNPSSQDNAQTNALAFARTNNIDARSSIYYSSGNSPFSYPMA